jgi:dTDP-4-amino-4,6-dideoxygalactose transaminase
MDAAKVRGFAIRPLFTPMHQLKPFREALSYAKDRSTWWLEHGFCLPSSVDLTVEEVQYVVENLAGIMGA